MTNYITKHIAIVLEIISLFSIPIYVQAGDHDGSRLLDTPHGMRVELNSSTGIPRRIEVASSFTGPGPAQQSLKDPISTARAFLSANAALLRIDHPESEFAFLSNSKDEQGITHLRFNQMYRGIEIWASDIYVHLDNHGSVYLFNGSYFPTPQLASSRSNISGEQALQTVRGDLVSRGEQFTLPAYFSSNPHYSGPRVRQVIWHDDLNIPHLAWHVELRTGLDRDWYYFVDAQSGTVLDYYNNTRYDGPATGSGIDLNGVQRNFGIYQTGSTYVMIDASQPMFDEIRSDIPQNPFGAIVTLDLRGKDLIPKDTAYLVESEDNYWTDSASISAQYNATQVYEYFRDTFGRNSIDDSGMTITSIIHVTEGKRPMDNAFWSGDAMCYGDGRINYKSLAGGFDVAAHELTHGITQYTANLVYRGQSGALDESMSDAFAATLDSMNWTMGEQIIKNSSAFPSGALRDLSDPHNGTDIGTHGWQPATMGEYVRTYQDNGGVHINSGIPNHAFYLVATTLGRPTAARIWFKALTRYLTSSARFLDARIATEEAAKELYGEPSTELTAVNDAWDNVQVNESTTGINIASASDLPASSALRQNYPNPFNPTTTIGFIVSRKGFTALKIYNVLGEEIATLLSGEMQPGSYEIEWNASGYASGTYFYRLTQDRLTLTRKLTLLK